ncbi:MAG: DUF4245 domain-containing protein [Mycobacteriales bacterium]
MTEPSQPATAPTQPGGAVQVRPARAKPTRSAKAMVRALIPILLIMIAGVLFFSPHGSKDTRRADVAGDLDYAAAYAGFTLPRPRGIDAAWRAVDSSVSAPRSGNRGPVTVSVSYLSPQKDAVSYAVGTVPREELVNAQLGDVTSSGSTTIGVHSWQQLRASDGRHALVGTFGQATVVIAGSGDRAGLVVLAASVS